MRNYMKTKIPVAKNQKLEATIVDLTYQGMGVAKVQGYPLFCDDALPGEVVELHVLKAGKNFGYAKVLKRLVTSKDRVEGSGKEYLQTGIAPLEHLAYPEQLKFKQKLIKDLLVKAHLTDLKVDETLGMAEPYGYRNKAQVPVRMIDGQLKAGFFRRGSHNFVPLENFLIQDERIDEVIQQVLAILQKYQLTAYDETTHQGLLRHLMVRRGHYSGEVMVVLVTNQKKIPHLEALVSEIMATCPDVVSLQQNINSKQTNVILGEQMVLLAGKEFITDQLNGLNFEISARSFYQVNPSQTEKLYQAAIARAGLTGKETVIDAYCGIGTISLSLARHAKKVYGVEIVEAAIADAKKNAALNGLDNLVFEVGAAEEQMATWQEAGIKPDVIMVDPPRKGLAPSLIESAVKMAPQKIVYVSCNPATLVRDLKHFMELGYEVKQPILPVDQFPQTAHVESVTVLERVI